MTRHLFLVMIGPVQEFIAGARRTRDLWFGSWLLSDLSRTAAVAIQQLGGEVHPIFPPQNAVTNNDPLFANVANKILATVSAEPGFIGRNVTERIRARLRELWDAAQKQLDGPITIDTANQQIDDLLEIYWSAVELPADNDYALTRKRVEMLLAARKSTRDFDQVQGAPVPKSSIDGLRESVIHDSRYPSRNHPQRQQMIDALYKDYRAGPAERLSGVDLLKRHGSPLEERQYFPSTADIAVRPLLFRLRKDRAKATDAWDVFLGKMRLITNRLDDERVQVPHPILGHYDGGLLLESRLNELIDDPEQRRKASMALADFFKTLNAPRPEPYYAIVLADGDHMGMTIDNQQTIDQHVELSRRLGEFAAAARRILTQHDGALIYAGGDDVMAFVPLYTMLDCIRALHDQFVTTINPVDAQDRFYDAQGISPTLSVGVAICHQIEPLSDALRLTREAEKAAKRIKGKDSLAITLSKRSGADVTVSGKWGEVDRTLEVFVMMHRIDTLPDGAAFQLRDLAERLTPKQRAPTIPAPAVLAEAKRIIGRKQPKQGIEQQMASDTLYALHDSLEAACLRAIPGDETDSVTAGSKAALAGLRAVADALIVARVLATAADHADSLGEERA